MPQEIQKRLIEEEMKESYVDYAMSVIVSRALPNVADGLKPVHRRVLYTMYKLGLLHNKPFKKSANVVGNVMAKLHPHGDAAIYDTLVRMAQNFSLRYTLIDGQGNFGSIDGFGAAAQRYTECRLSRVAQELLTDIEKNTVKFVQNYDNSTKEPYVLPAKLPNLLINGSSGIAVGMATNIPPHNLSEVIDAIVFVIDNPDCSISKIMEKIKGPDFPTGAYIYGSSGIKTAYYTGRGKIILRAKTNIENNKIIITEIPYMINKSLLLENIAELVKNKVIEDISNIRDESDREGLRIVIETKKNSNQQLILNKLFKHSSLQETFGIIMLALVDNTPKTLNLKEIIEYYIRHRIQVVTSRTQFDLQEAQTKAHILEGLKIALDNIDDVIKLIKSSKDIVIAKSSLIQNYSLSELQAQSILEMRLQRLTSLEQEKIVKEHEELLKLVSELQSILDSKQRILDIIKSELLELKKYSDPRKTEIIEFEQEIEKEDLIKEQDVVVITTNSGYIKQIPLAEYKQQKRGGKGITTIETKEEDIVESLFITSNLNTLLFFTNKGKVHWLKAYEVPLSSRYSKGKAIINLLNLDKDEKVNTILPIKKFDEELFLTFATKQGIVKKTPLFLFSNPRKSGILAIKLNENDEVIDVILTNGSYDLILASKNGSAVKFNEKNIKAFGRNAAGVHGIRLINDELIGLEIAIPNSTILTVTENGYGKRSTIDDYRLIRRGGKGVINIKTSDRNGNVVSIKTVFDDDEIMLITKKGITIRIPCSTITTIGRNTQGFRIMKLDEDDKVADVVKVV
jgi:DNA gyrase subunit A